MIVVATIFLVTIIYLYIKWIHSYWKRVGLEYIKPDLIYGIVKSMMVGNESIGDFYKNCYEEFKSKGLKHGGIYELFTPTYVPTDLEIIKCVLQKDFSHFMNHGEYVNEEHDPLTGHLLSLENEKWKKLRAKLTLTFTSGKMKMMFPTMVSCTAGLEELLKEYARIQDPVFIKDILSRFTTDIIGSAAFGIDCNSLKNPKSEFREFGNKIFKSTVWRSVKRLISNTLPRSFLHYIGFKRFNREIEDFFMGVVRSTVNYREKNNIYRKDFMHLLLQLKNKGKVTDDEDITPVEHKSPDGHFLTFNEVAAQCFIFFLAGFETSGTTMTFALLELAQNPDVQEKLRTDIKRVLKKYDNQITYEAIMEMTYLEKVVNETLRKHPPLPVTGRVCNEDYVVPGTDILIKRGVRLRIPILGLHRDPEYYPEPERFDPERFNEENTASRPSCAFMPFGEGPRACIGARFGLLQSKVGLFSVINNFEVTLNQKTKLPITYVPQLPLLDVVGDVWLNINTLE